MRRIILAAASGQAPLVSELLFAAGAAAVEETVVPRPDGRTEMTALFPEDALPLESAPLAAAGASILSSRLEAERDWDAEWRRSLAPIPLGERLVILPPSADAAPLDADLAGRIPLALDPGYGFGSGSHATTALSAAMVERVLTAREPGQGPASVLDVGTGSGILAIAAAKLGARPILAIDVDPEAVVGAARNARVNGCEGLVCESTLVGDLVERYDLVVANLDRPTLALVGAAVAARVRPGGDLVISGLKLAEPWPAPADLTLLEQTERDGWRCERWRRG